MTLVEDLHYSSPMGWLSPSGRYFACINNGHRAYALGVCERFLCKVPENVKDKHFYAEERLLKAGWMKLTNENVYPYYCKYSTMYNHPTREQFDALLVWSGNNRVNPPWEYKQSIHATELYSNYSEEEYEL